MADFRREREEKEFEEKVVQVDRITRVVAGGRRLRFRATVVVGDKKGRVGVGVAKGLEVVTAIQKAVSKAKKAMVTVPLKGTTVPHEIIIKYCGAKVLLKPATDGTGIIAGGAVRSVLEVAGVQNVLSKMLGSSNKINNVYATFEALKSMQKIEAPVKEEKKEAPKKVVKEEEPKAKPAGKEEKKETPAKKDKKVEVE